MSIVINRAPWLQFADPLVRDLAFVIAAPPLICAWPQPEPCGIQLPSAAFWQRHFERYLPRLQQLDMQPAALYQAIRPRPNLRLGYYFEDLLAFWLADEGWHEFVLIGHGIPRMDGKRTLGEVDFLLENIDTGCIEHWEVALKFYLGEAEFKPAQWVGLNQQDTLGRKLHHLRHKQFEVRSIEGYRIERRRAVIKGRLFWPIHQPTPDTLPDWIHPDHLCGTWSAQLTHVPTGTWRRSQRVEWLTERQESTPSVHYWTNGLYLSNTLDQRGESARHMLRLMDVRPPWRRLTL